MASGSPLMSPMMMSPPTSLRRRRLLGRSQEAVCEGEGEHLPICLGIVDANDRPEIAARGSPAFSSLCSHEASEWLPFCQCCSGRTPAPLLPGAPACRPWTDGRHEFSAEDNSHGVLRREVHRVTSPDGPLL